MMLMKGPNATIGRGLRLIIGHVLRRIIPQRTLMSILSVQQTENAAGRPSSTSTFVVQTCMS